MKYEIMKLKSDNIGTVNKNSYCLFQLRCSCNQKCRPMYNFFSFGPIMGCRQQIWV